MKTDRFEKTIRQKLESISPDFHESDWAKMQNYMHAHTPPTFWQQYGSWLGYAAAASVTTVMAFVYTNQLSQNNQLREDIKGLRSQIEAIRQQPIAKSRPDTVYIVRTETVPLQSVDSGIEHEPANRLENIAGPSDRLQEEEVGRSADASNTGRATEYNGSSNISSRANNRSSGIERIDAESLPERDQDIVVQNKNSHGKTERTIDRADLSQLSDHERNSLNNLVRGENKTMPAGDLSYKKNPDPLTGKSLTSVKTLGVGFEQISFKTPLNSSSAQVVMQSTLMNRMSPKQIRKTWMAVTAKNYQATASDKKTTQVAQTETVIPRLNIKLPYRFGGGLDWQKGASSRTITGEVIVAKNLSISTGISWMKLKQMEFVTEKIFKDANKQDFKQSHKEVPKAFVVTNIKVAPSLVQLPLSVAFRNDLKDNWAYYAGTGINITLNSKEAISYTCLVPNPPREGLLTQSFERKMNISPINSVNFSFGIEKSWHPIVIQAEGYIYTYFKQLNPLYQRGGPGVKVKLLYQIGKKI